MNKQILKTAGFGKEVVLVENGFCPFCKNKIGNFRNEISLKEFRISGLCQDCQDKTFEED